MHPVISFFVAIFNMIKLRVWPKLLPWVQPQRLIAAFMIIGGQKQDTTAGGAAMTNNNTTTLLNIPKRSTRDSQSIDNVSRKYSTSSSKDNKNKNQQQQQKQIFKDSYLNESFWRFSSQGPAYAVNPNNIEFIQEPDDFYNHLIEGIKKSTKRITFASLYLGTGKHEQVMVDELVLACERNKELKVHILLDGLRGSREALANASDPSSGRVSSATILQPLLDQFPDRVTISMYHTPDLNGILKRVLPPRVNETIGVNHIKTYVFDNDLLMSGANLSKDYFTNRQDRYVWVKQSGALATFFDTIVGVVGSMSLTLTPNATGPSINRIQLPSNHVDPVSESSHFKIVAEKKLASILQPDTFYLASGDGSKSISSPFDIPVNNLSSSSSTPTHTWIFPTIQMGPFSIRQDEVCTSYIFSSVPAKSRFYITSPYFNLTKNYLELIMRGRPPLDIITCSPEANGFYGAKGLSGAVPDCYAIIEKNFLDRVKVSNNSDRIKVEEYIRKGWTYHAKGLWITAQDEQLPSVTLIGSPNFGSRSVEKDLEAQMIVMTEDSSLQKKMESERVYLWRETQTANNQLFQSRKAPIWVRILVYIFGNYL